MSATFPIAVEQTPPSRDVDFNKNGWLDLLWHHQTTGLVSTWLMSGTTVVSGQPITALFDLYRRVDTNWKIVGAADRDKDGWVDLVWQHGADGRLVYSTTLNGSVQQERTLSPDVVVETAWKIKAVADPNQDGLPDLVWQHETNGAIAIWFMNGPTMERGVPLGPGEVPDLGWKIVGSGDFNRDGWQDLVWQHQGDGRISVWKMRESSLCRRGFDIARADLRPRLEDPGSRRYQRRRHARSRSGSTASAATCRPG